MWKFLKNLFSGLFASKSRSADNRRDSFAWNYCFFCDGIFFEKDLATVQHRGTNRKICRRCRRPENLKKILFSCDMCNKVFPAGTLIKFDFVRVCRECLERYFPLCPECHQRITIDKLIFTTTLKEYCRPCAKKLGLKELSLPKNVSAESKSTSPGKKIKSAAAANAASAPSNCTDSGQTRHIKGSLAESSMASLTPYLFASPPPPPPPAQRKTFSSNSYYNPAFDDNLPDDFVIDGIGGLDDKHDV